MTDIFKRQIWERAIIVFTFADYVNDRHVAAAENPSLECVMEDYAKNFGEILEAQVGSFTVLSSLFHIREGHNGLKPGKIPALPAAETVKSKLLKWDEHLYLQMLTKCSFETVPILVKMEKNLIQKTTTSMSLLIEMCIIGVNILGGVAYLVATSEAKLSSAVVVVAGVVGGVTIFLLERNEHMSSARSISYVRFQEKK